MRFRKTLATLLASTSLAFSGCDNSSTNSQPAYETISRKPLGVAVYSGQSYADISVVVENENKPMLCLAESGINTTNARKFSGTEALIQSRINDGNKQIELTGKYEESKKYGGRVFIIKSVKANGYQIDF